MQKRTKSQGDKLSVTACCHTDHLNGGGVLFRAMMMKTEGEA
ncbi:hypothetical protein [Halobacillus litoralis]|nr:hypothetical protein [Halobacillus litoralis]